MTTQQRDTLIAVLLAAGVFSTHVLSPNATPFDSRWTVHTARSLLQERNADLNEYLPLLKRDRFYAIECVFADHSRIYPLASAAECAGGRFYHFYPLAVPVLVAPAVGALELGLKLVQPWLGPAAAHASTAARQNLLRGDLIAASMAVELILACLLIAGAAAVFYFVSRMFLGWPGSAGAALLFAFATSAWSTGSRALWMHSFSMLLLTVALLLALRAPNKPACFAWLGAVLSLAFYCRPTNAAAAAIFGVWILMRHRRQVVRYLAGMLPPALLFSALHLSIYGLWVAPYSQVSRPGTSGLGWHPEVVEALAGNLISPGRGLFIYTPVFLFAFAGFRYALRRAELRSLAWALAALILVHWLLISLYRDWFGGDSYGPRYFSDLTPIWSFLLLPLLEQWKPRPRTAPVLLFGLLTAASVWIHKQGATCWPCVEWNNKPSMIRNHPERLWDYSDPAFMRGLRSRGSP